MIMYYWMGSQVELWNEEKNQEGDIYRLPIGIRMIDWNDTAVYINSESVYLKGFGRHEDANVKFSFCHLSFEAAKIFCNILWAFFSILQDLLGLFYNHAYPFWDFGCDYLNA